MSKKIIQLLTFAAVSCIINESRAETCIDFCSKDRKGFLAACIDHVNMPNDPAVHDEATVKKKVKMCGALFSFLASDASFEKAKANGDVASSCKKVCGKTLVEKSEEIANAPTILTESGSINGNQYFTSVKIKLTSKDGKAKEKIFKVREATGMKLSKEFLNVGDKIVQISVKTPNGEVNCNIAAVSAELKEKQKLMINPDVKNEKGGEFLVKGCTVVFSN
jgi:hypothetical protein